MAGLAPETTNADLRPTFADMGPDVGIKKVRCDGQLHQNADVADFSATSKLETNPELNANAGSGKTSADVGNDIEIPDLEELLDADFEADLDADVADFVPEAEDD